MMLVSDAIINIIEGAGSKFVFGVPGSTIVPLISAVSSSHKLKFVFSLHENASLGMADGYARESGEFGVVFLHTTPGLTTAMPNLYNSFVDDVPLLILVGDVNSKSLIQEPALALNNLLDTVKPLTAWSYYATSASDAVLATQRSLKILHSSEPGPCCILIPEDVLEEQIEFRVRRYSVEKMLVSPDQNKIRGIVRIIHGARWPILIVGREIRDKEAVSALSSFCTKFSIPVLLESPYPSAYSMGFPQDHPCYLGLFRREARFLKDADLVVALGGEVFAERKYYEENPLGPRTKLVHIHSNPWEIGKNLRTDIQLLADPQLAALMMAKLARLFNQSSRGKSRLGRIETIRAKRAIEQRNLLSRSADGHGIKPWNLVKAMKEALRNVGFVIVDEGVVASSYLSEIFEFTKAGSLIGRSAGCLGWGLNAAIGVKLASPQKKVIAFVGDGALLFNPQGLWTAAHSKLPMVAIVCNNAGYASVRLAFNSFKQRSKRSVRDDGCDIVEPSLDIVKLCESLGANCTSVKEERMLLPAIKSAISSDRLEVIDAHIDPNERGYEGSVGMNSAWT